MSVRVMAQVWELPISSTEKLVLLALADCANDEGECWPSIATIGRKACIGERSVQRSIQSLKDAGHLTRNEVNGKGCRYIIHPRHNVTPATVAPVTNDTPPPPQWHPTPATVAPKPSLNHQEPSEKKKRAHVLPDGWKPSAFGPSTKSQRIIDGWPPGHFEERFEHFTAHHTAKGSKFEDWQAAWSTWVLNSPKFNGSQHGQRFPTPRPSLADIARNAAAELEREAASGVRY